MNKTLYILFILEFTLFSRCANQQVLLPSNSNQQREIDPRAVEYFVDGVIHDLNEDYPAALLSYQEALLYDSSASELYLAIGKDYLRLGKEESSLISLLKCLNRDSTEIEAQEIISKIYIAQQKWDLSEKMLLQTLDQDSMYVDTYYNLALIYLQRDELNKAIKMYQQILSLQETPDPQILLSLGEIYLDQNQFENAAEMYTQFTRVEPYEGLGYYGLGLTREALKDTTAAIEYFTRALQLTPDMNQAKNHLIQIYTARQEWEPAIYICQKAIEIDSTDLNNWLDIADIYKQKGDSLLSLQTLEKAKRLFADDWRIYSYSGRFYLDSQKFDFARQEFKKVTELAPDIHWGWLYSGISLVYLDSLENSQYYFQKALNIEPDDPMANYYLGSVLTQLKRPEDAIPYLENALTIRSDWISAISTLAGIYDQLKYYEKSDSLFNEALRLDPDNALIMNNYGYSLSERGIRLNEAMEMAQKALKQDPENGAYLDTVGWIYYKIGEYEKALEYITKAFSARQESAILADHLGDVYDKLEMKEEARKAWEKALELDQSNQEILRKLDRITEE